MALKPISKIKPLPAYAVYDLETSVSLRHTYLLGYQDVHGYRYWESPMLPPEHPHSVVTQFLKWYLTPEHRNQWLFAHNGGNFDHIFCLAALVKNFPQYKLELIPSQSSILMLRVSPNGGGKQCWKFLDSARTLTDSLDSLGKCFLGEGKIEVTDYSTLHTNPLRYEYLQKDCDLLYRVIGRYFTMLRDNIKGQPGISAASTALATYRTSFQEKDIKELPDESAALIRQGYYGGRCEIFRKEFKSESSSILHDYDVNSLYPTMMREPQPVEQVARNKTLHLEICGFIDATVEVGPCHIPVLPYRGGGKLLFPTGRWRGTFSTVELRLAEEHNQLKSIRVHDAIYFRTSDIFSRYVDRLYKLRDKSEPDYQLPLDRLAKILLNSLYGKFGSSAERETIHIRPSLDDIIDKNMQEMPSPISVNAYLERTVADTDYMLPQISAWITALGRCRLAQQLLACNHESYYCDTDAVFTPMKITCGTNLGQWKDEYEKDPIQYAYFVAPKVYVLKHESGRLTNKAKGFARFGEKLPDNAVAILQSGESLPVSRFTKARSVIRGDFGLILSRKQIQSTSTKRVFHKDGTSTPIKVKE
jgi:hypothetical protein